MTYLNIHQAAARLGMHPETIRQLCRRGPKFGGLTASKGPGRTSPWRIAEAEIPAWYARNSNTERIAA